MRRSLATSTPSQSKMIAAKGRLCVTPVSGSTTRVQHFTLTPHAWRCDSRPRESVSVSTQTPPSWRDATGQIVAPPSRASHARPPHAARRVLVIAVRVVGALAFSLFAGRALATTAADLCPASADPCNVSSAVRVDPGSTIDVGKRRLVVHPDGSLAVGSGLMVIRCGALVVQAGGTLLARGQRDGGSISVTASGDIRVAASDTAQGQIDASADSDPGDVSLTAGGDVTIDGLVTAQAISAVGDGGSVTVSAGDGVVLTGRIGVGGGGNGGGGTASIDARRDVAIDGPIDASGGETDGGSIDVSAGGNLVT